MNTKMIKSTLVLALALVTLSFTTIEKEKKQIKAKSSSVKWVGKKITGQHDGTINVKNGFLTFKGEKLVGGTVVIDMNSIVVGDLEGKYKGKLEGHLKADDFFGVEKHKTSKIVFKKVKGKSGTFNVTADLTIKGITKPVIFDLSVTGNVATAKLKIDRTQFGIKYGSSSFFDNLQDKAIDNEFELEVSLSI
jgi:polyisoprenoid-binding protein YceI